MNAPVGRRNHTAVWTGSRMFVWGGYNGADTNTGGLYDPVANTWLTASTVNAPSSGSYATSVWTGSVAVIWGGTGGIDVRLGGRYDPSLNSWTPTSTVGAPLPRYYHSAVWTGSFMVVWDGILANSTGGRYALGHAVDNDGDGYAECTGDCNDGNPGVHAGMAEVCDGRDNDCDGLSDEDFGDADGDLYGDACDCAPNDPSAFVMPAEVRDQEWPSDASFFWWAPLSGGSGTVYDVVRGRAGEWPVGAGPSEVCHEAGSVDNRSEDLATPAAGFASYYLVRGRNACGAGSYGRSSSGGERVTSACP